MKRKHCFEDNLNVITISENINEYEDYFLCYKKTTSGDDRMFYWCLKKEFLSSLYVIDFKMAGPCKEKEIKPLKLNETITIKGNRDEYIFEKTN